MPQTPMSGDEGIMCWESGAPLHCVSDLCIYCTNSTDLDQKVFGSLSLLKQKAIEMAVNPPPPLPLFVPHPNPLHLPASVPIMN